MKTYKVVITPDAEEDLKRYLRYLKNVKLNPYAAKSVAEDYIATKKQLSAVAGSIGKPDSEKLCERGLKRINFLKHDYFILYKLKDDKAIITNIFHALEDHENKLK